MQGWCPGQGKSVRISDANCVSGPGIRAFFVHGFAKNERHYFEKDELAALKKLAAELSAYDDKTLARVI